MKLLFSDFDQTLFFGPEADYAPLRAAVARWQAAGNQFWISTGRPLADLLPLFEPIGLKVDGFVAASGAMLHRADGTLFWAAPLPPELLDRVFDITCAVPVVRLLYVDAPLSIHRVTLGVRPPRPEALFWLGTKTDDAHEHELTRRLRELPELQISRQGALYDLIARGTTKATGIERAVAAIGGAEEIFTVGDGENDVEMLSRFTGFAMRQGHPSAQKAAKCVTDSVPELIETILEKKNYS